MGQQVIAHADIVAGGAAGIVSGASQNVCQLGLTSETGSVIFNIDGGWGGTVQFEGSASPEGILFYALAATPIGGGSAVTSAAGNGCWQSSIVGLKAVRMRCSSYGSGTIAMTIRPSNIAP